MVPPELTVLGLRGALPEPVRPVGGSGQTGLPRVWRDRSCILAHSSVFGAILCQHMFWLNPHLVFTLRHLFGTVPSCLLQFLLVLDKMFSIDLGQF